MKKIILSAIAAGLAASTASAAVVRVTADITTPTTWTSANEYVLTDIIYVRGATLTIEPGTIIRGEPKSAGNFDPGTLVVTRTGQIDAEGNAGNPIIFTTAALDLDNDGRIDDETVDYSGVVDYASNYIDATNNNFLDEDPKGSPLFAGADFDTTAGNTDHIGTLGAFGDADLGVKEYRGLWGGIIVLGNAPTNIMAVDTTNDVVGPTLKASRNDLDDVFEGFIEGLDPNDIGSNDGVYGGTNPNDSSGTLKYVSIRHGGTNLAANNEINGLTMGGVGFGTLIEYVEVYCNNDDGFEWFGGTANSRYLVSLYNNDDSFDIDEGFTGLGQFWFSLQIDDGTNGDHGGEHDGTNGNFDNANLTSVNGTTIGGTGDQGLGVPVAFPTIYNATYVSAGSGDQMLKFEDSFGCNYYNSVFVGAEDELINASGTDMDDRIAAGDADFVSNSIFYNINGNTGALANADLSDNASMQSIIAANGNLYDGTNPFATLTNSAVRANVDPRASAATFTGLTLADTSATFFITAGYVGAFNPTESAYWTDGWSVFSANYDNK